jgi:hypothetical protein
MQNQSMDILVGGVVPLRGGPRDKGPGRGGPRRPPEGNQGQQPWHLEQCVGEGVGGGWPIC